METEKEKETANQQINAWSIEIEIETYTAVHVHVPLTGTRYPDFPLQLLQRFSAQPELMHGNNLAPLPDRFPRRCRETFARFIIWIHKELKHHSRQDSADEWVWRPTCPKALNII